MSTNTDAPADPTFTAVAESGTEALVPATGCHSQGLHEVATSLAQSGSTATSRAVARGGQHSAPSEFVDPFLRAGRAARALQQQLEFFDVADWCGLLTALTLEAHRRSYHRQRCGDAEEAQLLSDLAGQLDTAQFEAHLVDMEAARRVARIKRQMAERAAADFDAGFYR